MELMQAIARRHSVRAYKSDKLSKTQLDSIVAAGCAAPVGGAQYDTLHLTVIDDPQVLEKLSTASAKAFGREGGVLYGAPAFVLISSKPPMAPGIEYVNAGCILENMMLAATSEGIGSVIIWSAAAGVNADTDLRAALSIPEGFSPVCGLALGYAAQDDGKAKELGITIGMNRV